MKRFLFLLFAICLAFSCGHPYKKMILDYLHDYTDGTNYTLIEVNEPDSLYSLAELITSLKIKKAKRYYELSKQLNMALDKPTMKERRAAALKVAILADAEYHDDKDLNIILSAITDPHFNDRPANRIAIMANVRNVKRLS